MQKKLLDKITHVLRMCKTDAEMAISGEWEINDEGFEAQIEGINKVLKYISVYKHINNLK